ncbi:probable serine/threonine-protein kinase WNK4 [Chenopodium quinoa]|uniref:probable serine/threonine-protein kinase WNK4 n=1 Tax=Chenopodium quinoa TaxID=63459 RepID=UPI000B77D79F|nr:probable serine/threonine-protein kinase WNK4 [Chenopodium quinoa]
MAISGSIDVNGLEVVERDSTGRYKRYGEIVGKANSKTIYKGFDEIEGIEVAWSKTELTGDIFDNISYLRSLKAEARLLKSLDHENIIKCYDYWIDTKTINMITELYTSGSLEEYFEKHVHFHIEAIKNFARQILEGLHYIHSRNPPIVHRTLNCRNIYVDGSTGRIMIANFGVAMFLEKQYYPVQLVDIYNFGMCFLQMLTGEPPYNECCDDVNERNKRIRSGVMPEVLSKVADLQVRHLIEKCLVPPACERPAAIELLNDPSLAPETFTRSQPRLQNSTSITNALRKFFLKFVFSCFS